MAPKTILAALIVAGLAVLTACQPAPAAKDAPAAEAGATAANPTVTAATIISITDAGYPMFVVNASVAGQSAPIELLLNAEAADLNGATPDAFAGKAVTLAYTNQPETSLTDIRMDGQSLLGGEAPALDPAWRTITGVLSGADDVTASDPARPDRNHGRRRDQSRVRVFRRP